MTLAASQVNLWQTPVAFLQARHYAALANMASLGADPHSPRGQQFQKLTGQAICTMIVFSEYLPEQFMASQSINMLDGTMRMPPQAFRQLQVWLHNLPKPYSGKSI